MLFVDKAIGSADLAPLLEKVGLPVYRGDNNALPTLEYADVEFQGRGVKGVPMSIGIEVKRLSELTGDWDRLVGYQNLKMIDHYDHRILIYEGEWTQNRKGVLLKRTGRRSWRAHHGQPNAHALRKKLLTLEFCGAMHRVQTKDRPDTVRWIEAIYRWATDEDMDKHKSHLVYYEPHGLIPLNKHARAFGAWPNISTKRAKVVASRFKNSIARACAATVEEWAELSIPDDEGRPRCLGMKTAQEIVRFIHGE